MSKDNYWDIAENTTNENDDVMYEEDGRIEPFDPKEININRRVVALETIMRRIRNNTIRLSPDFQRDVVWNETKKSLLIESLMLGIPLPMFYVAADRDGNWDVVDGLQRLTAIKQYIVDKNLILCNLEFWSDFNSKTLEELPPIIYNRIMETEFTFVVIEPNTPENVKYNIFKRINTGGEPLTPQEIRNALYHGVGTKLLKELATSEEFIKATGNAIRTDRMFDQECVLRVLAFILLGKEQFAAEDNGDTFLSRTLQTLNALEPNKVTKNSSVTNRNNKSDAKVTTYSELRQLFKAGLDRSYQLFGNNAFRIINENNKRRGPINRALMETISTILAELPYDDMEKLYNRKELLKCGLHDIINEDKFYRAISKDVWTREGVRLRFDRMKQLVQEVLNDNRCASEKF